MTATIVGRKLPNGTGWSAQVDAYSERFGRDIGLRPEAGALAGGGSGVVNGKGAAQSRGSASRCKRLGSGLSVYWPSREFTRADTEGGPGVSSRRGGRAWKPRLGQPLQAAARRNDPDRDEAMIRSAGDSPDWAMRQRLYAHVVWTTRDRKPLIDARVARFLMGFLRGVARQEGAQVLEVGLVADHVHLLVRLDVTTRLPRLVQRWKGGSAAVARQEKHGSTDAPLRWSKGYAIQSVSPRALQAVRAYLRAQSRHHPHRVIAGWKGDPGEYDPAGADEWRGRGRMRIRARRVEHDPSLQ